MTADQAAIAILRAQIALTCDMFDQALARVERETICVLRFHEAARRRLPAAIANDNRAVIIRSEEL